jgi:hypothetical protein
LPATFVVPPTAIPFWRAYPMSTIASPRAFCGEREKYSPSRTCPAVTGARSGFSKSTPVTLIEVMS